VSTALFGLGRRSGKATPLRAGRGRSTAAKLIRLRWTLRQRHTIFRLLLHRFGVMSSKMSNGRQPTAGALLVNGQLCAKEVVDTWVELAVECVNCGGNRVFPVYAQIDMRTGKNLLLTVDESDFKVECVLE